MNFENINPVNFNSMREYIQYKLQITEYEETLERMETNNPSLRNLRN